MRKANISFICADESAVAAILELLLTELTPLRHFGSDSFEAALMFLQKTSRKLEFCESPFAVISENTVWYLELRQEHAVFEVTLIVQHELGAYLTEKLFAVQGVSAIEMQLDRCPPQPTNVVLTPR